MDNKYTNCILTNMVFLKKDDYFLVIDRNKKDWPGISFIGGHVNKNESIYESAIRETKEESGLIINSIHLVDIYEWEWENNSRYLAFLYFSDDFSGELKSSIEGKVFFIKEEELKNHLLSQDFLQIYNKFKESIYF